MIGLPDDVFYEYVERAIPEIDTAAKKARTLRPPT